MVFEDFLKAFQALSWKARLLMALREASVDHSTIFCMLSLEIFVAFSRFFKMVRSPRITASRTQWMSPPKEAQRKSPKVINRSIR